jgi:hypothetical protein
VVGHTSSFWATAKSSGCIVGFILCEQLLETITGRSNRQLYLFDGKPGVLSGYCETLVLT